VVILFEKSTAKREADRNTQWDISWRAALAVFKTLSVRKDIIFWEVGPDRSPLGNQPIIGLKVSGNDVYIYGKQTGYIIFGGQVSRVIRKHLEVAKFDVTETISLLFSPYKELEISWTG
jgi:hypothetical protein